MQYLENILAVLAYRAKGWKLIDRKDSIMVLRKGSSTMMCHGSSTIYSISNLDSYYSNSYWDLFIPLPGLYAKPKILMIGLGGGTIARQISAFYESAEIEIVEINEGIAELATKYFPLPNANIIISDGAAFVKEMRNAYDLIILDAFIGNSIPSKFMKSDFFSGAYAALKEKGILAVNCISSAEQIKKLANGFVSCTIRSAVLGENSIVICSKSMAAAEIKEKALSTQHLNRNVADAYAGIA